MCFGIEGAGRLAILPVFFEGKNGKHGSLSPVILTCAAVLAFAAAGDNGIWEYRTIKPMKRQHDWRGAEWPVSDRKYIMDILYKMIS